ncbi:AraC family transcriptional regulator [Candidatus Nomurabacteria bacterium]|nr:AraC family transcriptional regulator [Candidatus Nomurabacteria bacterium]
MYGKLFVVNGSTISLDLFDIIRSMKIQTNSKFDSYVNHTEMLIRHPGFAYIDHEWSGEDFNPQFSRIYFFDKGEGIFITDHQSINFKSGHAYLLPSGLSYKYKSSESIEKLFFHISILKPNGDDLLTDLKEIIEFPFNNDKIKELTDWYFSDRIADTMNLKSALMKIISDALSAHAGKMTIESYSPVIQDVLDHIKRNLDASLSLNELADKVYISKNKLSKLFREEVGITVNQYIESQVFFRAKLRLEQQGSSILQISNDLGFCDQFYFSRRFRHFFGESPLQYRKRYLSLLMQKNREDRADL